MKETKGYDEMSLKELLHELKKCMKEGKRIPEALLGAID